MCFVVNVYLMICQQKTQSIATLLEIKTPGSKVDRNLGFDLLGDMTDLKDVRVHLGFSSPWKSAKVTGLLAL